MEHKKITPKKRSYKTKTTEEYKKEYYEKFPNSTVVIEGEYVNTNTPIKCSCSKCNYIWEPKPHKLNAGRGCPQCAGNLKYTTETFKEAYYKKFPDSTVIIKGKYKNCSTHIECECSICNYNWETTPSMLLNIGVGCKNCKGLVQYTTETFIQKLKEKFPFSDVMVIGKYVNTKTNIKCQCRNCGHIWETKPHILINGHGCPNCRNLFKSEKMIEQFLKQNGILHTREKMFDECQNIKKLRFDFYIDDYRFEPFLIEYQGQQHVKPVDFAGKGEEWANMKFEQYQKNDKIKYDYCQKTGKNLEYIWYYEDKIAVLIELLRKYIKPEYNLDDILKEVELDA